LRFTTDCSNRRIRIRRTYFKERTIEEEERRDKGKTNCKKDKERG
jgi:hypothetical protein